MKLAIASALGAATFVTTAASPLAVSPSSSLTAGSELGRTLLMQSRNLEQQEYDWETAMAWLSGYSVKFQGCHQIKQWNDQADEQNDVRIQTKRLVRFRLCPSDQCSASKAAGCSSGYGDYVVDMDTFVQSYVQGRIQQQQYDCQYHLLKNCDCDKDGDHDDDSFNEEYCQYDCFNDAGLYQCIDRNPYADGENEAQKQDFNIEKYLQCNQLKIQNNNQRDLNENNNQQVQYFVGPYCAAQGGSIKLGLFSDDTCSEEVSDVDFKALVGFELPYSTDDASLIDASCLGCLEKDDAERDYQNEMADDANNANDDAQDADQINEMCENLYTMSGKCEANYPSGMLLYEPNNNACTYMEGIRIVRQDGIIDTGSTRPSAVATAFIVIFAMAFAAMAFYVWYLRTRLGVKKHTLL
jgi:hypothetical protein